MSVCSTTIVPLTALLAFILACTGGDGAQRADAVTSDSRVVTLTATDYAFEAPDTIPVGFTTLRLVNDSEQLHMAHIIRLEAGRTVQELVEAYAEAVRTVGPRPAWATRHGGPVAPPHGQLATTQDLEPGSYALVCLLHLTKGMARGFVVQETGDSPASRTPPQASVVIQLADYAFRMSTPLTEGRHTIRVENLGAEPHEISMLRLAPGKSMEDLEAWRRNPQGPPPASLVGAVAALKSNAGAYFEVDITPADYVLLCFVTAPDGRPHVEHGMIQHIRIP